MTPHSSVNPAEPLKQRSELFYILGIPDTIATHTAAQLPPSVCVSKYIKDLHLKLMDVLKMVIVCSAFWFKHYLDRPSPMFSILLKTGNKPKSDMSFRC